ncbi:MAG: hypothetical protein AAGG02_14005 [Cyanobacteria bacterium P01_H01_bin.15]
MHKLFIGLLAFSAGTFVGGRVQASQAYCVVEIAGINEGYQGDCTFTQFGGNGSFVIESNSGLIAGKSSISVTILSPGVAEVRGLTTAGINSRWGEAKRSTVDKACWVGQDFSVCAY